MVQLRESLLLAAEDDLILLDLLVELLLLQVAGLERGSKLEVFLLDLLNQRLLVPELLVELIKSAHLRGVEVLELILQPFVNNF